MNFGRQFGFNPKHPETPLGATFFGEGASNVTPARYIPDPSFRPVTS
jgi:hypothetical protein